MKRLIAVLLVLTALAAFGGLFRSMVELTGADMAVEVPAGWRVMTRSNAKLEANAAMFGMTAEEAVKMMEENDFYLILYEPSTGAEMYVTVFGSQYAAQLRSFERLSETEMELAKADVLDSYPDWEFDSEVTEQRLGDFTYLAATMHLVQSENPMDNRQLFTVYDGQEIYIDLYAGESGLWEEHVAAQNALAESLQVDCAQRKLEMVYKMYVGAMVTLMAMVLIQFVGVALTVMLHIRGKME